mmetsp:Transcript_369/g.1398  ORF Transcript_369/g.1398 Transcript_369/m.1398 type:complete len:82 (-) Transcript_369:66-311(-)
MQRRISLWLVGVKNDAVQGGQQTNRHRRSTDHFSEPRTLPLNLVRACLPEIAIPHSGGSDLSFAEAKCLLHSTQPLLTQAQ